MTPASHSFAVDTLSLVETKPSNVPCDSASGTFGQAVVFGMPPKKLMRQLMPAPPGLRIFSPLMSADVFSGTFVVYQFWKPRSTNGPTTWTRSLLSICPMMILPAAPSEAFSVTSMGRP